MEGPDAWGLFERNAERYPVLEADEQLEVWARYAQDRDGPRGQAAFAELVGANWRLAKYVVTETLKTRERRVSAEEYAELASEANVALCEAISDYDPDKGGALSSYVATGVERRLSDVLSGDLSATWSKVKRIAGGVESALTNDLGRVPNEAELVAGVQAHCLAWARERLVEAGEDPSDENARAKLVRQGTWAAIGRLGEIRGIVTPLSLDLPSNEGLSLADLLGDEVNDDAIDVMKWFLDSLSEVDKTLVTRRFGLDGRGEARFEDLAAEREVEWPVVRAELNATLGRMYAPHAHYASLGDLGELIIDDDALVGASGRLAARRAVR